MKAPGKPFHARFANVPPSVNTPNSTTSTTSINYDVASSPVRLNAFASRLATSSTVASSSKRIAFLPFVQRLERVIFQGIPPTYPLRAKMKITLDTTSFGMAWDIFQSLASLLSCITYVASTYHYIFPLFLQWTLTIIFSCELLLRYYVSENRWAHTFEFFTLIDLLTVLPMYIQFIVAHTGTPMAGHRSLFFLRFARTMNIMRIVRTFRFGGVRRMPKSTRQCSILGLTVVSLVFLSAGLVQLVERDLTFGRAVYFMIVTMSTVGYGDIHPTRYADFLLPPARPPFAPAGTSPCTLPFRFLQPIATSALWLVEV